MCGRFNITDDPVTIALFKYFGVYLNIKPRLPLYNMAPTEPIPIILEKSEERIAKFAVWWFLLEMSKTGLKPKTAVKSFNARTQLLSSSRLWRGPFKTKRCMIPATSWIEYTDTRSIKLPKLI